MPSKKQHKRLYLFALVICLWIAVNRNYLVKLEQNTSHLRWMISPYEYLLEQPEPQQHDRVEIIGAEDHPLCAPQCLFLFWQGRPTFPVMYEVGIKTAIRAYGRENIVIVSNSITNSTIHPTKDDFPLPVIWNISLLELAQKLEHIHEPSIWENFLKSVASGRMYANMHMADFVRIALVYLYGGLYADMDSLWIRPAPTKFPIQGEGNDTGKTLFRVIDSNGVLGGVQKHPYYRKVLEKMPFNYDPNEFTGIGAMLLNSTLVLYPEYQADFMEVTKEKMYGIEWQSAERRYAQEPLKNDTNGPELLENILENCYQLHMYGKLTHLTNGSIPLNGSLYDELIRRLGITYL